MTVYATIHGDSLRRRARETIELSTETGHFSLSIELFDRGHRKFPFAVRVESAHIDNAPGKDSGRARECASSSFDGSISTTRRTKTMKAKTAKPAAKKATKAAAKKAPAKKKK